ncbi:hypothetical protein [Streptomyces sp. NPDC058374]
MSAYTTRGGTSGYTVRGQGNDHHPPRTAWNRQKKPRFNAQRRKSPDSAK